MGPFMELGNKFTIAVIICLIQCDRTQDHGSGRTLAVKTVLDQRTKKGEQLHVEILKVINDQGIPTLHQLFKYELIMLFYCLFWTGRAAKLPQKIQCPLKIRSFCSGHTLDGVIGDGFQNQFICEPIQHIDQFFDDLYSGVFIPPAKV